MAFGGFKTIVNEKKIIFINLKNIYYYDKKDEKHEL